jgi:hypothetical protein
MTLAASISTRSSAATTSGRTAIPEQSVLASDTGSGPLRVVAARAKDGSFVIAYASEGKLLSINMDKVSGTTVKAKWYDPREGTLTHAGEFPNTGRREFVPPPPGARRAISLASSVPIGPGPQAGPGGGPSRAGRYRAGL